MAAFKVATAARPVESASALPAVAELRANSGFDMQVVALLFDVTATDQHFLTTLPP
jgi:hypothetical protein